MQRRHRLSGGVGLSRLDAGRAFFGTFYAFILVGWYPELQVTYTQAGRGSDVAALPALVGLAVGAAWGSGSLLDVLLVATAAGLGSAAGFALGGALVADLAAIRPFYASALDPGLLEAALWGEFIPSVVGPALGALGGGAMASLRESGRTPLGTLSSVVGLLTAVLAVVATVGLGASSIGLVVAQVTAGAPAASIDSIAIRVTVLAVSCLAAASAVLVQRRSDGATTVSLSGKRLLAGVTLAAIPQYVAALYTMFVVNPF